MRFRTFDNSWARRFAATRRGVMRGALAGAAAMAAPRYVNAEGEKVLRVRSNSDIQSIDPYSPAASADQDVMMAIFNKLVGFKPGSEWDWQLEAAEEIDVSSPTDIKFRLMPNIMWTDGYGELTTEDVKYSFERLGALESWAAIDWSTLETVEIIDKYNGVIHLNAPFAPLFRSTMPYGSGSIVCKKAVEELSDKIFTTTPPAQSGPYKIRSWDQRQKLVLERHDGWPGKKPYFDVIEIFPIEDEKTAEVAYEAGDLDMTQIAISSVPQFEANLPPETKMMVRPPLNYEWIGMNVDHPPFDDERVRRAIQLAIDVNQIIEAAFFGVAERSTGIIAPGLIGHRDNNIYNEKNLDEARKLLAEAGLADGFDTTLSVQSTTDKVAVAQVIQANLAEIGINVEVLPMDSGTFWTLGIEAEGDSWKDLQMIYNNYSMAPDPFWATAWFVPEQIGEWNWERWNSPDYATMHDAAVAESDPQKRHDLYVDMQDMMEESGAYIFVTHGVNAFLYRDNLVPALSPSGESYLFRDFGVV
ncbi:MAG: ABC transporter substrate-binding protein [Pseudomonadota bacterium]